MLRFQLFLFFFFIYALTVVGQDIVFSLPSTFYVEPIEVALSTSSNFDIRYTLDNSEPTSESPLYTAPILINDRSPLPNVLSNIPTNPPSTPAYIRWQAPQAAIPKSTILKAALFENENRISLIAAKEYFIGDQINHIQLPIVSIWSDSVGFFGFVEGIYVPGKDYEDNPLIWHPGNYYERGDEWERIASIGFYENKQELFRQTVEVEIHGDGSRIMPCKSLRISAKESLGQAFFDFPFFEKRDWALNKKLILRNSGQDFIRTMFADVLMHSLLSNANIETQHSYQVVVFLNGEYWGIHNMRERYDKYYFSHFHDGGLEDLDLVEISTIDFSAEEGSAEDFENLLESLAVDLDLSEPQRFEEVASQIDIDNFITEHISKVYGGGEDWGSNNNEIWRPHSASIKWRWAAKDYDDTFMNFQKDAYKHATNDMGTSWPNPEWSTRLFRSLMTNKNFARQYKTQLRYHLDHTFHPDRVVHVIDSIANIYRPEMNRQIARWNHPASMSKWEENISIFKTFAQERPAIVWQNFNEYFPEIYLAPQEVTVAPNPAQSFINIDLPDEWVGESEYFIFNYTGQLVQEGMLTNEKQNVIPLHDFSMGIYIVQIKGNGKKIVKSFFVKNT